jgi:hypothetical protein
LCTSAVFANTPMLDGRRDAPPRQIKSYKNYGRRHAHCAGKETGLTAAFDVREEIESAPISSVHWKLGIIMFFDSDELFNAGYAIPLILKAWRPSPSAIGMMLPSGIVGLSIGSLLQDWLADRPGRRRVMLWALYGMGTASLLLAAIASTPLQFAGFRLCLGTARGMITPLAISYINEWAPTRTANVYTIWVFQLGLSVGRIAAGAAGAMPAPYRSWWLSPPSSGCRSRRSSLPPRDSSSRLPASSGSCARPGWRSTGLTETAMTRTSRSRPSATGAGRSMSISASASVMGREFL